MCVRAFSSNKMYSRSKPVFFVYESKVRIITGKETSKTFSRTILSQNWIKNQQKFKNLSNLVNFYVKSRTSEKCQKPLFWKLNRESSSACATSNTSSVDAIPEYTTVCSICNCSKVKSKAEIWHFWPHVEKAKMCLQKVYL